MRPARLLLTAALAVGLAACNRPTADGAPTGANAAPVQPEATAAAIRGDAPPPADAAPLATPATLHFYANGSSPAWRVEGEGETLKIDVPEHNRAQPGFATVTASHSKDGSFEIYSGKDDTTDFNLTLDPKAPCNRAGDEEGRRHREFEAILTYGGTVYKGCADRR